MTVYPYIVVLSFTHPRDGAAIEHTCSVEAYTLNDALMQAGLEIDAQHRYVEQGYKMRCLSARHDTEKARAQIVDLLKEAGLLRMPTGGRKQ